MSASDSRPSDAPTALSASQTPLLSKPWFALLAFVALSAVHLWPISLSPATISLNRSDDAFQIGWVVNWIARELPRNPFGLLDGNIFYPAEKTLVLSEPLLIPGLMGVPAYAVSSNPVLTHNLVWLAGFVLSAFAMYLLVLHLTRDGAAAFVAGTLFIFNAHIVTRYLHLMAVHMEWLPLALLALERYLKGRRLQAAAWLGVYVALAALTSGHLAVYTVIALGVVFIVRSPEWLKRQPFSVLGGIGIAAVVAAALALPFLHPWLSSGLQRPFGAPGTSLSAYLVNLSWLHSSWGTALYDDARGQAFFPGITALGLAAYAMFTARGETLPQRRRLISYALLGLVGIVLSFGLQTPALGLLHTILPPARAIRAVSRFGYLFLIAIAILAGFGLASLRRRHAGKRWLAAATALLVLAVNVEAFAPPTPASDPFEGISRIYENVRRHQGDTVLLEVPYYGRPRTRSRNAEYMFNSTAHWKPLVNGYASYTPQLHARMGDRLSRFPEVVSLHAIRRLGVTHVMVNGRRYGQGQLESLLEVVDRHPSFRLVKTDKEGRWLYRIFNPSLLRPPPAPAGEAAARPR